MKFYNRLPLTSTKYRIIDLQHGDEKKSNKKKQTLDNFQFNKRGDRSRDLSFQLQQEQMNDSRLAMLDKHNISDITQDQSALNIGNEIGGQVGDGEADLKNNSDKKNNLSMSQIDEEDEIQDLVDFDLQQAQKVKSMSVYEMLQDPQQRLVLTNISQFQDDSYDNT